jgi:peptidoglycan/LPS O-acetylase OafA/YrhL
VSPKPAKGPHLTYRPGLDGLRALAVIGVFLYHMRQHAPWLPGGFLGVDLFFVLSGYLITSILLVEWEHHHRINLLRFWGRRARRLFPAVVVVVLAALLLSAIFARNDLARTRSDAISSLFYFTNWHLVIANHSYFTLMGLPSLLQHFWSLAVEEQFYIVWPLLLVPGLIFLRRRWLPFAVIAGIAISAPLMWLLYNGPDSDPSRVYYGTDTRAFLLLMGILLALWWPYVERIRRSLPLLELLGIAALGMTIWLFATLQDFNAVIYQGGDLAASFCFAVLIAAVAHPRTLLGKAFGVAPLRWVGERSYGIYLWHWPIIALTRPGVDVSWTGAKLVAAQAALTVAAAALSYRFVEQPIRTGRAQKWLAEFGARRRREIVAAGTAALVAAFAVLFVAPRAASGQPPGTGVDGIQRTFNKIAAAASSLPNILADVGKKHQHKPTRHHLPPGRYLAIGDSVMRSCSSELETSLRYRVRVDAAVSRQIDDTIAELNRIRHKWGNLPKTVIIQVGNNGPLYYADLVRLKTALRGVPDIVVVNVRNATSWQDESNRAIAEWMRGWRVAHLADWYHHSTDKMLSDGTHPWPYACVMYARLIATTLRGTTPKT